MDKGIKPAHNFIKRCERGIRVNNKLLKKKTHTPRTHTHHAHTLKIQYKTHVFRWGLAQLHVVPGAEWCGQFAGAMQARAEVFSGSHVAVCLWALGRMGHKPQPQALLPTEAVLYRYNGCKCLFAVCVLVCSKCVKSEVDCAERKDGHSHLLC